MTEVGKISVTQAAGNFTFSSAVLITKIFNSGTNPCYINLNADATTSHFKLDIGEEIEIGLTNTTKVSAICDTGLTTTLNIIGATEW